MPLILEKEKLFYLRTLTVFLPGASLISGTFGSSVGQSLTAYPLMLNFSSLGTSVNVNNLGQVLAHHTEPGSLISVLSANPGERATGKLVGRLSEF